MIRLFNLFLFSSFQNSKMMNESDAELTEMNGLHILLDHLKTQCLESSLTDLPSKGKSDHHFDGCFW